MFPNPALDEFWLDSPAAKGQVELVDAQGRVLRRWMRAGSDLEHFDFGGLPAGWYVLNVQDELGSERHTLQVQY